MDIGFKLIKISNALQHEPQVSQAHVTSVVRAGTFTYITHS